MKTTFSFFVIALFFIATFTLISGCISQPEQKEPEIVYITVTVTVTPTPSPIITTPQPTSTQYNMKYPIGSIIGKKDDLLWGFVISDINYDSGEYGVEYVERAAHNRYNWARTYSSRDLIWLSSNTAESLYPVVFGSTDPQKLGVITWDSILGYQVGVIFDGDWIGTINTDGDVKSMSGPGNRLIHISDPSPDIIVVNVQKTETAGEITLALLHNGETIRTESTIAEYGIIMFSYSP